MTKEGAGKVGGNCTNKLTLSFLGCLLLLLLLCTIGASVEVAWMQEMGRT